MMMRISRTLQAAHTMKEKREKKCREKG